MNEIRESDPENAILTALALHEEAHRLMAAWLGDSHDLPMQIGIDTGVVLIQANPNAASTTSGVPITIVERADGNPFYVEELVKILIEDGVIVKGWSDDAPWRVLPERLADLRVPPTLTGVLQARLDTLEPAARLLLGRASIIGRRFWTSAVTALEHADGFHIAHPDRLLEDLRRRELVYLREKSDFAGTQEYVIKHAILRDVIYETLLNRQQRAYHAAAAAWLIAVSAERADEYNALIAEHYEKAGQPMQSVTYLLRAVRKAIAVNGFDEAVKLTEQGLALLPPNADEDQQRLRLQLQVEQIWIHWHRWQLEAVASLGSQALALARTLNEGDTVTLLLAHLGLNEQRRNFGQMAVYLQEAEARVDLITDPRIRLFVLRQIGGLYIVKVATTPTAIAYYKRSLVLAPDIQDSLGETSAYNALGNAYITIDQLAEARTYFEKSIALSKAIGALSLVGVASANLFLVYQYQGDLEKALKLGYETQALYRQIRADPIIVEGSMAVILGLMDASRESVVALLKPHLEASLAQRREIEIRTDIEVFLYLLTREGDYERAADLLGVWYASPVTDMDCAAERIYPDKARAIIAEHLSAEVLDAAIARGRTLDIFETAQALLATL